MHLSSVLLTEQRVHNLLAVAEVCALDPLEGIGEVKEATAGGELEYSERSYHPKPHIARDPDTLAVVQEHEIGTQGSR